MKNLQKKIFFILTTALLFSACQKVNYYDNAPIVFERTLAFAHRGGGNDSLKDNSYEACINSLSLIDGLEVDVQLSKDRTIWLSHSAIVEDCGHH